MTFNQRSAALAATSVFPTSLAKPTGAGNHITQLRILQQSAVRSPAALFAQIVSKGRVNKAVSRKTSFID